MRTDYRSLCPADVAITMKGGRMHSQRSDLPLGSLDNPMDFDALADKFRRRANYSGRFPKAAEVEALIGTFGKLESLQDVRTLVTALA